jgi:hypothetical protein
VSKPKRIYRTVPHEERYHLIAEAAYFRAERRNFQGGCPIQDWLEAECEIEKLLSQPPPPRGALVFLAGKQRLHPLLAEEVAEKEN